MSGIFGYIAIAIVAAVGVAISGFKGYHFYKLGPDGRKKILMTYLEGIVVAIEEQIGSGNGKTKMELAEKYFNEKAPFAYKMILRFVGKENLKDLIEDALKTVKAMFGQKKEG